MSTPEAIDVYCYCRHLWWLEDSATPAALQNLIWGISVIQFSCLLGWPDWYKAAAKHSRGCVSLKLDRLMLETLALHLISDLATVIYKTSLSLYFFIWKKKKKADRNQQCPERPVMKISYKTYRGYLAPNRHSVSGSYYHKWQCYFPCFFCSWKWLFQPNTHQWPFSLWLVGLFPLYQDHIFVN